MPNVLLPIWSAEIIKYKINRKRGGHNRGRHEIEKNILKDTKHSR